MDDLKLETLNEIISEVLPLDCSTFSNLHDALLEFNDNLDKVEMADYLTNNYSVTSEAELVDLTDYEKDSLIDYIKDVY
jgi:hypothetical protein